jgi:hypothetical protein
MCVARDGAKGSIDGHRVGAIRESPTMKCIVSDELAEILSWAIHESSPIPIILRLLVHQLALTLLEPARWKMFLSAQVSVLLLLVEYRQG